MLKLILLSLTITLAASCATTGTEVSDTLVFVDDGYDNETSYELNLSVVEQLEESELSAEELSLLLQNHEYFKDYFEAKENIYLFKRSNTSLATLPDDLSRAGIDFEIELPEGANSVIFEQTMMTVCAKGSQADCLLNLLAEVPVVVDLGKKVATIRLLSSAGD